MKIDPPENLKATMFEPITFIIPGAPVGKGRPKFARRGAFVTTYTPEKTASYENLVKVKAEEVMQDRVPTDSAVSVRIELYVTPPASWSKKKQDAALADQVLPMAKPDIDNVVKGILDALNDVVWKDDKQVCDLHAIKRYGTAARAVVRVRLLQPMKQELA